MGIPYFASMIRTQAQSKEMSTYQKLREQVRNVVGGWKEGMMRKLSIVPPRDALELSIRLAVRRKLTGDYVEFGVFTGRSTIRCYHLFRKLAPKRPLRILAFDSFEGLPAAGATDHIRYKQFTPGTMSCSAEEYQDNCKRYGVPLQALVPIKGWFEQTCNKDTAKRINLNSVSIALIDCDFYSSTYTALQFIGDYMEDGGIIVFDDWNCFLSHPQLGQRGAFARWVSENPHLVAVPIVDGAIGRSAFSIHRRLSSDELEAMHGGNGSTEVGASCSGLPK